MINKISEFKFENKYPTLAEKVAFLKLFDLINLQKASKIGNISPSKSKDRRSVIKAIIAFDLKNNFLICKNIFKNTKEYGKPKIDDVQHIETIEWNRSQFGHYSDKDWEKMIDEDHHTFEFKELDKEIVINSFDSNSAIKTLEFTKENALALNNANEHLKKIEQLILDNKVKELELLKKEHDSHIENLKQVLEVYLNREDAKMTKLETINDKILELNNVINELQKKNDISDELLKKFYSELQTGNSQNKANDEEIKQIHVIESKESTKMCCQNKKIQELLNKVNNKNEDLNHHETYLNLEIDCQHPFSCCLHDFEEACAYIEEESRISELGKEGLRFLEEKRRRVLQNDYSHNNLEIKVSQVVSKTSSNCQWNNKNKKKY